MLVEYLVQSAVVFESIVQLLANAQLRALCGHEAVLLLSVLVNYRKYSNVNACIVKLSILDDDLALNVCICCCCYNY